MNMNLLNNFVNEYKELKTLGLDNNNLYIKYAGKNTLNIDKGLGVFTNKKIYTKQVVGYFPCIEIGKFNIYENNPRIVEYTYWYNCDCNVCLKSKKYQFGYIALGYGSIINTSDSRETSNVDYYLIPEEKLIVFTANTDIEIGEEILAWNGKSYYNQWCKG